MTLGVWLLFDMGQPMLFLRIASFNDDARIYFRWTPHPVIVTIRDNKDYIRVSHLPSIPLSQGLGVPLNLKA